MSDPKRIWARWLEFPEGMSGEGGRCLIWKPSGGPHKAKNRAKVKAARLARRR